MAAACDALCLHALMLTLHAQAINSFANVTCSNVATAANAVAIRAAIDVAVGAGILEHISEIACFHCCSDDDGGHADLNHKLQARCCIGLAVLSADTRPLCVCRDFETHAPVLVAVNRTLRSKRSSASPSPSAMQKPRCAGGRTPVSAPRLSLTRMSRVKASTQKVTTAGCPSPSQTSSDSSGRCPRRPPPPRRPGRPRGPHGRL